ncbi:SDR family NAD(P)-dependent oxidoreductase [Ligilactobacillus acidipiscis]|uniref:SDR family NAD(P)-dependent oxidoreductase n=1 Tax=Ligilactobacillus acidipiscis TaxID=89059 RepID=UPI0023FA0FB1|nr:SDR family NAD(P)-dependent oxidoreductase [Ligilactobacillus acidipiscis]WEV58164.1 SDR family NAD(P)-dependent oxidoreductase [Ligilactobacillus acidipiscis]
MPHKIIITGANRGIGFEMSKQLAMQGYPVILGVRELDKGQNAVDALTQLGISETLLDVVRIDLQDAVSITNAVNYIAKKHPDLDFLVNNAGIAGDMQKPALKTDVTDYQETFDTNFFGTLQVIQHFLPLIEKNKGKITAITGPFTATTWYNPAAYRVSKIALNGLLQTLAVDVINQKIPISIFGIFPGGVSTEINGYRQGDYMKDVATGAKEIINTMLAKKDYNGKIIDSKGNILSEIM